MTELASPGQLRAAFLRWALFIIPGIMFLGFFSGMLSGSGPGNVWFIDLVKPALYLSPRQSLDQVLPLLRSRADHMAVVVDEFGSAIGILTMEDIFEEVVGPVDSGFDFDGMKSRRISIETVSDDAHLISGRAPISELNDSLKLGLPVGEAHTIAGFLINRLRRIPQVGDTVQEQGYRYTVIEADARTATKVRAERI